MAEASAAGDDGQLPPGYPDRPEPDAAQIEADAQRFAGGGVMTGTIVSRTRVMAARVLPLAAHEAGITLADFDVVTMSWVRDNGEIVPVMALVVVFAGPSKTGPAAMMFQWIPLNHWYPDLAYVKGVAVEGCGRARQAYDAEAERVRQAGNGQVPHVPGAGLQKIWLPGQPGPGQAGPGVS